MTTGRTVPDCPPILFRVKPYSVCANNTVRQNEILARKSIFGSSRELNRARVVICDLRIYRFEHRMLYRSERVGPHIQYFRIRDVSRLVFHELIVCSIGHHTFHVPLDLY